MSRTSHTCQSKACMMLNITLFPGRSVFSQKGNLTLDLLIPVLCGVLDKQVHCCSACIQQPAHVS